MKKVSIKKAHITFSIDPRIELLYGLQYAYYFDEGNIKPWLINFQNEYTNNLIKAFNIKEFKELSSWLEKDYLGFYDSTSSLALLLDDNCQLKNQEFDHNIKTRTGISDENDVMEFNKLLKEFTNEINYDQFLKSNNKMYKKILKEVIQLPSNFSVKDIEKFYGYKKGSYNIVLSPLIQGAFGVSNNNDLYCIKGIYMKEDEYYPKEDFLYNLFHEFSHPYVNPLYDKYKNKFKLDNEFLEEAKANGLESSYNGIATLINEYVVRANEYILAKKYINLDRYISNNKRRGYIYIDLLISLIENKKNKYSSYEKFYVKELIPFFNKLRSNMEIG